MMTGMDWDRLSQAIIDRRAALGYRTREQLAAAANLSSRLLGDLEHNRRQNYDRITLARVEGALEWETGTIHAILQGKPYPGMPTEVPTAEAELSTLAGLHAWLHRMEPAVLGALLHRSNLDFEAKWKLTNAEREVAITQLRANWVRLAEQVLAAGGVVDPETWPSWLEAPPLVEEIRKKNGEAPDRG